MHDHELICQLVGALTIFGAMLLIFNRKIYLNAQATRVTKVQLPLFARFQTNSPALVLFFFGFALAIFPVVHPGPLPPSPLVNQPPPYFTVEQEVDSDPGIDVNAYAVAAQTTVGSAHHLKIAFPDLPGDTYLPHLVLHANLGYAEVFRD